MSKIKISEIKEIINKLESIIGTTPSDEIRNTLCDVNILLLYLLKIDNIKLLYKAYEHGVNVGTYNMSKLSSKYAPLTFDAWYAKLQNKLKDKKDEEN